jgi:hypothetical protein
MSENKKSFTTQHCLKGTNKKARTFSGTGLFNIISINGYFISATTEILGSLATLPSASPIP